MIEEMRRAQPGCINFILTGHPARESSQRAARYKVAHYFIKPVDAAEMVNTIRQKLTSHHSSATIPKAAPDLKLKYPWQQAVLSAFMEGRSERLPAKINAAERAIAARLCDPTPASVEEQAALQAALRSLRMLFPASKRNDEPEGRKKSHRSLRGEVEEYARSAAEISLATRSVLDSQLPARNHLSAPFIDPR